MIVIESQKQKITAETGQRIRYFRQLRGISQEALALKIGMSPAYLGHLERGLKCPTIDTLHRITDALDVSLSDFFSLHSGGCTACEQETRVQLAIRQIPPHKMEHIVKIIEEMAALYKDETGTV
ncbi:helix-turn-helix domain-containing protein [Butyricicoccus sp.]|uniref:helix-turn-helix domain-containing protein n=1 Tax=Butyricicoccus sp. TaxID=2049021 RepID=UPI003F16022E